MSLTAGRTPFVLSRITGSESPSAKPSRSAVFKFPMRTPALIPCPDTSARHPHQPASVATKSTKSPPTSSLGMLKPYTSTDSVLQSITGTNVRCIPRANSNSVSCPNLFNAFDADESEKEAIAQKGHHYDARRVKHHSLLGGGGHCGLVNHAAVAPARRSQPLLTQQAVEEA